MVVLQAEKVWKWCKSPGGTLGLIRNTKKWSGINIHSHCEGILMGTTMLPIMSFLVSVPCCVIQTKQ